MRRKDREVTDTETIEEIIKACKTCHLAMVDEGKPYVVPLNFGYELDTDKLTLYFHSAKEGKKLDILHKNSSICFDIASEGMPIHAESPCNCGYYFSSIIGMGTVEFIEDTKEKCKALSLLMKHQADRDVEFNEAQVNSVCVYKVSTSDYSGKKKQMPR